MEVLYMEQNLHMDRKNLSLSHSGLFFYICAHLNVTKSTTETFAAWLVWNSSQQKEKALCDIKFEAFTLTFFFLTTTHCNYLVI